MYFKKRKENELTDYAMREELSTLFYRCGNPGKLMNSQSQRYGKTQTHV